MGKWFYIPKPVMSQEEADARLAGQIPNEGPSDYDNKILSRLHVEVAEGIKYAKDGNVQMANSIYASVRRKAAGKAGNENLLDHLDELKGEMDCALKELEDRRRQVAQETFKVETITIRTPKLEEFDEPPVPEDRPVIELLYDSEPIEHEDRIPRPDYNDWTEAEEACGYR